MAVNRVDCKGGRLTLHGDCVVTHQTDIDFSLEGDRIPNFLEGSKSGDLFLTTTKIIFVNKKSNSGYDSFSMNFQHVRNIEVKQPMFGANYLKGYIMAEPNGGWEGSANFKATFSSGGAIEFAEHLKRAVGEAARNRQAGGSSSGQQPPGGFYPPPPMGGYYCPPYNSGYPPQNGYGAPPGMPQNGYGPAPGGSQPNYAPPMQGAPPPYPGNAPTSGLDPAEAKAREAYSSGSNVYIPAQNEAPPPYVPGYGDKKNQ